jgi:exosortase
MSAPIPETLRHPAVPRPGPAAAAVTLAALAAVAWHRTVVELWRTWQSNDNYSHGPLVPLVSAALVWLERDRLRALPRRPDARGLALVALACAMLVLGVRADVFALQGWSLLPLLAGLALAFAGPARTRALAFPIGYLAFMLTFPPVVMNRLSFALKEVTVALSTRAAEALGVVLQRDGMALWLGSGVLEIENPCSGLRSLLALVATGAVFGWLQPGGWWRRLLVAAAAVPIAMLGNAARITLLILAGHYADVRTATGLVHDLSGYVIYAVALAGLLAVRALLMPRPGAAR